MDRLKYEKKMYISVEKQLFIWFVQGWNHLSFDAMREITEEKTSILLYIKIKQHSIEITEW